MPRAIAHFAVTDEALGFLEKNCLCFPELPLLQLSFSYKKTLYFVYYKLHTELNKRECSRKCEVIFQTCHFLTRFVEIADRQEGDKYYSNWRSLECFKIKRSKDIC